MIVTDKRACVELINPAAENLTGWKQEEAQGRLIEDVFRIINEDTRMEVENPVSRVIREGLVAGLANHTLLIAKEGTERPIADSGAPIFSEGGEVTGVVLVFSDQTEERSSQKALEESENRYRLLIENSIAGIVLHEFVYDEQGNPVYVAV